MSVTAGGPESPRGHMWPTSSVDFNWSIAFCRALKFSALKLIKIFILWVYYTTPFGFSLFWHFCGTSFQLYLAKDHWWGLNTRNAHMVHIVNLIRFNKNGVYILVEIPFHIVKPGLYRDSKLIPCELFAKYMPKAQCYADTFFFNGGGGWDGQF